VAQPPDPAVRATQVSVSRGIKISGADHRKRLDVHGQDAEQRNPAQHVDADDALFFTDGLEISTPGLRRIDDGLIRNDRFAHGSPRVRRSRLRFPLGCEFAGTRQS
jgi:hypothetical protein